MDGHIFHNVIFQSSANSQYGFKRCQISTSLFTNCFIWDSPAGLKNQFYASGNYFLGGYIDEDNFSDSTLYGNTFMLGNRDIITPIGKRLWVYDNYANRDSISKIIITGDVATGTTASPAGDIGIKIGRASNAYRRRNSANGTARIISRNMAGSHYGSHLIFQTHGSTSDHTNYVTVMDLDHYGGVNYPPRSTGDITAGTGITTSMCARFVYYNGSAAVDITANPQIADSYYDGKVITIIGSSDVNTLTLDDGTGLALTAQCVLGAGDTITLIYVTALDLWVEVSRANN